MQAPSTLAKPNSVQSVPTPSIGRAKSSFASKLWCLSYRLKKIEYDLLAPPRIYGHETAGVVAAIGEGVTKYSVGDRVIAFHHIPAETASIANVVFTHNAPRIKSGHHRRLRPAGGGFAQYIRVMDWIVERGGGKNSAGRVLRSSLLGRARHTCLKGVDQLAARPGDVSLFWPRTHRSHLYHAAAFAWRHRFSHRWYRIPPQSLR